GHISLTGYEGQASIAVTNSIGIIANISDMGTVRDGNSINYTIDKHNFKELGAGYYINKLENRSLGIYFIAGNGITSHFATGGDKIQGHTLPFSDFKEVKYSRYLIQADYGIIDGKYEYAISPRLFLIHYYDIKDNTSIVYKELPNQYLYSDVAFTFRYKLLNYLKISGQFNFTVPLTGKYVGYYEASPLNCSIGVIADMYLF
ncbi:MAG: hypothetical protein ACOYNS_15265, partial [Bacteroidota bacterium]